MVNEINLLFFTLISGVFAVVAVLYSEKVLLNIDFVKNIRADRDL